MNNDGIVYIDYCDNIIVYIQNYHRSSLINHHSFG